MKELIVSFVDNLKERTKSPFYGSFVFSWLVFNWKPLFILLFSHKDIYTVLGDLKIWSSLERQLYHPLLLASIMLFLIPLFNSAYSFFDGVSKYFADVGLGLRAHLNTKTKKKRENVIELIEKNQKNKLAKLDAETIKSRAEEAEEKLKLQCAQKNLEDMPQLLGRISDLELSNKRLSADYSELMESFTKLMAGEKPSAELLPSNMTSNARVRFMMQVNEKQLDNS